jgi:hypothetical protein
MPLDELTSLRTSRRTIAKTGAKLAYAAPVVAATMQLSGQMGAAASPIHECNEGVICGQVTGSGCGDGCNCTTSTSGSRTCYQITNPCPTQSCTSDSDCGAGSFCQAAGTGCCGQVCFPHCAGAGSVDAVDPNAA